MSRKRCQISSHGPLGSSENNGLIILEERVEYNADMRQDIMILYTFAISWSDAEVAMPCCCVVLIAGGEGREPCRAERLGSNFASNLGSYFDP